MDPIATSMIVLYLVVSTVAGSLLARRTKSSSDWAVAGGGMGVAMIAVGVAGTRIGGVGTYGVAGDVIAEGMWNFWYAVSTFFAMALVGLFFAVPYRRLGLQTIGEIFWQGHRSARSQRLVSLCVQTEYLIVNIIEPFVIGKVLSEVTGMPFVVGVYVGAVVIISYTALGGLWGSAATNIIHCSTIVLGLSAVAVAGFYHLGGSSGIEQKIADALSGTTIDEATWWSFTGAGWMAIVGMIFSVVIHTPGASVYVNFSSAAKNEGSLLPGFLLGGLIGAAMSALAGVIGMQTLAKYGTEAQLTSYENITRLATDLNPWFGGIAVAAVLAAVISSGGPILLSSSTMFVNDWLPFARRLTPARRLLSYRVTTLIYGLVAATIAWIVNIRSILDLLLFAFAMVVPPAIAVGYLIYWKRTTEQGAFWGTLAGYATGLAWYGANWWAAAISFEASEGSSLLRRAVHFLLIYDGEGIDPSYATTIVPLVVIPIISLIVPNGLVANEDFYRRVSGETELDAT